MDSQLKILFVEDSPDDLELILIEFEKKNIEVEWTRVQTKNDLINEIENKNWDIIISDYMMPGFTGMDAIKAIREHNELIPVIVVSGTIGEDIAVQTLKAGATDYLMKGRLTRLVPAVERAIDEYKIKLQNKKAVQALEKSETKFRLLADHTYDWEYWVDPQGNYIYVSPSCEKISGYSVEKFYANSEFLFEIIHPDFRKQVFNHFKDEHEQKGKFASLEFCIITANNEQRWIEHICRPVFDKKGEFLGRRGTNRDITQRKQNEKEINTLAHAIRSISDCVSMTDTEDNTIYVNDAFLKTYGYNKDDVIGKCSEMFRSDKTPIEIKKQIIPKTLAGGWKGELWNKKKDGSDFQISLSTSIIKDETGKTIALVGVSNDITERKRSELLQRIIYNISNAANTALGLDELIEIIKDQLQQIIDVKNFYVAFYNKLDDTFTSPYMLDEQDKFATWDAGKTFTNYVYKSQKSALLTKDDAKKLEKMGEVEFVGTLPEVWLGVPLKVKGETYGVFAIQNYENKDAYTENDLEMLEFVSYQMSISIERKKAESELKVAYERALESDRLKSAFLATMSHELRTPLNAIIGFSDLIREKLAMEKVLDFASIVNRSGRHLLEIVEEIFDVTLLEVGQFNLAKDSYSLASVMKTIDELVQIEKVKIDSKVEVVYKPTEDENEIFIFTDKSKFKQIIINLLKNALKFTQEGYIEYGYEKIEEDNKPLLRFYVKDTGIGIAKDKQEFIFDIFRQVDETLTRYYGGTGIGLFVVKRFTEILGGRVDLESEEGKGSVFYVTIPYLDTAEPDLIKEQEDILLEQSKKTLENKTFLIVEDDKISVELLEEILKDIGIQYIIAENGEEAVKICSNGNKKIDLILMDLKMPVMDGYEATKRIKKKNPEMIIVAQTAHATVGDKEKVLGSGFDYYISKPILVDELLGIIKTAFVK